MSWQQAENKVIRAFDLLLGVPTSTLSTEFRQQVRKVLQTKYPDGLEDSALRSLVEGKLGRSPIVSSRAKKAQVGYALILMDVLETLRKESLVGV